MSIDPTRKLELNPDVKRSLPLRAYMIFALTLIFISVSMGVRLSGISLDRLGRALIDGPTLIFVAFSSLIWSTYRNQKALDLLNTKQPQDQEKS